MNPNQEFAHQMLQQAQQALKAGDASAARGWAAQAARAAPEWEDVWLMMAAVSPPQESVQHLERALRINPGSERARKGMEWARKRLQASPSAAAPPPEPESRPAAFPRQAASVGERTQPTRLASPPIEAQPAQRQSAPPEKTRPARKRAPASVAVPPLAKRRRFVWLPLLALLLCAIIGGVIWWGATPAAAFFRSEAGGWGSAPADAAPATQTSRPAPSATDTPTVPPTPTRTATLTPTFTHTPSPSPSPTASQTPLPTETPSLTPTDEPTPTPLPTDTEVPTPIRPTSLPPQTYKPGTGGERWIDVDLSRQRLYAYEGDTLVRSFVVSTGTWQYPTVTGQYRIYIKYRYKDMSGPGYYLKNVPYTMFFYKGYAIHGTYWHNNFGTPMSHGCVNLTIADAEWLYNFASVGTLVNVHY